MGVYPCGAGIYIIRIDFSWFINMLPTWPTAPERNPPDLLTIPTCPIAYLTAGIWPLALDLPASWRPYRLHQNATCLTFCPSRPDRLPTWRQAFDRWLLTCPTLTTWPIAYLTAGIWTLVLDLPDPWRPDRLHQNATRLTFWPFRPARLPTWRQAFERWLLPCPPLTFSPLMWFFWKNWLILWFNWFCYYWTERL